MKRPASPASPASPTTTANRASPSTAASRASTKTTERRASTASRASTKTTASRASRASTASTASSKTAARRPTAASEPVTASELISRRISDLGDWRGEVLAKIRAVIKATEPAIIEEWKWMGTPVWSHEGILCTGESYKSVVKMTFPKGAALPDPAGLFNSSLEGNVRRAIDIREDDKLDVPALKALLRAALALNAAKPAARKPDAISSVSGKKAAAPKTPSAHEKPTAKKRAVK